MDAVLRFLLHLTGFPPAALAFQRLYKSDPTNSSFPFLDFFLLAEIFASMCSLMVPDFYVPHPDSKLEASRQVLY